MERNSHVLNKQDEKMVQLFDDLGMPKNLAKTLLYISKLDECYSADIERGTDLRQPEVSVTMQELRRRGWVKKHDLKKKEKGRPIHIYKPTVDLSKIVETFEQQKTKEFETVKKNLSELKTIVGKMGSLS